jgi:translation initiation factor 2 gamma subunit (eIF-2gamma)
MPPDLSTNQSIIDTESSTGSSSHQAPLSLPAPSSMATKLDMSGEGVSVKLDHLGPIVVGTDGKLSRISNWENMMEIEKTNTLRVLGKRNKERIEALKAAEKKVEKEEACNAGARKEE